MDNIKRIALSLAKDKKEFITWLEERSVELRMMFILCKDDKKKLTKMEAKLEFILEILDFFNKKRGDDSNVDN